MKIIYRMEGKTWDVYMDNHNQGQYTMGLPGHWARDIRKTRVEVQVVHLESTGRIQCQAHSHSNV